MLIALTSSQMPRTAVPVSLALSCTMLKAAWSAATWLSSAAIWSAVDMAPFLPSRSWQPRDLSTSPVSLQPGAQRRREVFPDFCCSGHCVAVVVFLARAMHGLAHEDFLCEDSAT
eukprot:scaffold870_cov268-Pinguiococcus_pyrenoidosus.AAC.51